MIRRELARTKSVPRVPQTCLAVDAACLAAQEQIVAAIPARFTRRQNALLREATAKILLTDLAGVLKAQTTLLREALIDEIEKGLPE